jgi:hypothetical protein
VARVVCCAAPVPRLIDVVNHRRDVVRKVLLFLICTALLVSTLPALAQGDDTLSGTVIFGTIALREGPGLDFPEVGQTSQGATLTLTGRTEDGAWYQATLPDDQIVWVADYTVSLSGASASLPVVDAPEPPVAAQLFVPPGCDYFNIGPFFGRVGQSIVLTQGWEAASEALIEDYLNNVIQIVAFDGRLISTYSTYRSDVVYDESRGTWRLFWSFDMGPVAAGEHYTEWSMMFSNSITDGLDNNNDGQPDTYGPEIITYGCTIIIE